MLARHVQFSCGLIGVLTFGSQSGRIQADTAIVTSVADTTLIETEPDNNLGGARIVNAGTTQNFTRNRGLFRFDIAGQIPPRSEIIRVDFVVEVTGQPKDDFAPSSFALHRVGRPWGEGDKASPDPTHPGLGAPATAGEATWNSRFAFTTNAWTTPGAAASSDYSPEVSAETTVYGLGDSPYTFASMPALVADVQAWLDDPATNYGWLLICESEEVNFTARRFASREDTGRAPYLVIEYAPPKFDRVAATNGQLDLFFAAQANQAYTVEFRTGLASSDHWSTLTNVAASPTTTNLVVSDPLIGTQRFFRLRLP